MFAVAFDVVGFDVFSSSLIEQIHHTSILLSHGTRQSPHCVPQRNRGALVRSSGAMLAVLPRRKISLSLCVPAETHRFIAAKYLNLWIIGKDGCTLSK